VVRGLRETGELAGDATILRLALNGEDDAAGLGEPSDVIAEPAGARTGRLDAGGLVRAPGGQHNPVPPDGYRSPHRCRMVHDGVVRSPGARGDVAAAVTIHLPPDAPLR
jgi:hypothetical protein